MSETAVTGTRAITKMNHFKSRRDGSGWGTISTDSGVRICFLFRDLRTSTSSNTLLMRERGHFFSEMLPNLMIITSWGCEGGIVQDCCSITAGMARWPDRRSGCQSLTFRTKTTRQEGRRRSPGRKSVLQASNGRVRRMTTGNALRDAGVAQRGPSRVRPSVVQIRCPDTGCTSVLSRAWLETTEQTLRRVVTSPCTAHREDLCRRRCSSPLQFS